MSYEPTLHERLTAVEPTLGGTVTGDAWLYAQSRSCAGEIELALAELGLAPRYIGTGEQLLPDGRDGGSARRPALAVVVGSRGHPVRAGVLAALQDSRVLANVPILVALDADQLHPTAELTAVGELLIRPFTAIEVEVRVRRAVGEGVSDRASVVRVAGLSLDQATHQVTVDEQPVNLTHMEFQLLRFLVTHPNRAYTREALLRTVWSYEYYGGARTVDVHMRRLRAKLGPAVARRMVTVRNVGYLFDTRAADLRSRDAPLLPREERGEPEPPARDQSPRLVMGLA